jgi:plastocyanin
MKNRWTFFSLIGGTALSIAFSAGALAYDTVQVTNGGTINGTVTFNGAVPTRKIVPTKDTEVCGGIRDVPLIKVGPDKAVQEVVVYLKDVKKGKPWVKTAPKIPVLDNHKCSFEPHVQVVAEGTDIGIHNSDPVLHNTHGFLDNRTVFNVALPIQGMEIKKPLKKSGLVRVDCDSHGWMRGWIYVADSPYYDITDEKGSFKISDVPPGDYTLVIWQEETGTMEKPVSVKAKETVTVNIELKK